MKTVILLFLFVNVSLYALDIRCNGKIYNNVEIIKVADKKVILFKADFPMYKSQPEDVKKQNKQLKDKFNVHGYPTILFINPQNEEVVATKTGYKETSLSNYIMELDNIVRKYNRQAGHK